MKRYCFICMLLFSSLIVKAQTYYEVVQDTVKVMNGEFVVRNQSKDIPGVLYNIGNGITQFKKLQLIKVGVSSIAIPGMDTLAWNSAGSAGKFFVLSKSIPLLPYHYYHPLAFEALLDSGKLYKVQALIYLNTASSFYNNTSIIRVQYSDTTVNEVATINTTVDSAGQYKRYALSYDKLLQSLVNNDTLKISFLTAINDTSGRMKIDSLSYMHLDEINPETFTEAYTVDIADSSDIPPPEDTTRPVELQPDEYFVQDSINFNFTPVAQNIGNWTDVTGDPSTSVITATAANGWQVSTVSTSLWNPDNISQASSDNAGERDWKLNDFFGFVYDSAVGVSEFVNYHSQFNGADYNLKISNLNPERLYRVQILGSKMDTGNVEPPERTKYLLKDGRYHYINTWSNTSKTVTFDTIQPDASGNIFLSVAGVDAGSSVGWSNGRISAMRVWEISKNDQGSGVKIALFHYHYDSLLYLNDGMKQRLTLVYYPKNMDPARQYPLLIYLHGQESQGNDEEILMQYGIPYNLEHGQDIYGIDAQGDTVRYMVVAPQSDKWSFSPAEINNMIDDFRSKGFNINDSLYLTGFSSGGAAVIGYAYAFPSKVNAVVAMSPAPSSSNPYPTGQVLSDTSRVFKDYYTHIWFLQHHDGFNVYSQPTRDSIQKYSPDNIKYFYWDNRAHSGFNWEYSLNFRDMQYGQTIYDFFANPSKNASTSLKVNFTSSSYLMDDWFNIAGNPADSVITATDDHTGFTFSSISDTLWDGVQAAGELTGDTGFISFSYKVNRTQWYTNRGTQATRGDNLSITGLKPNTMYVINLISSVTHYWGTRWTNFGINNGAQFKSIQSNANTSRTAEFEVLSDASGKITISTYYDPAHATTNYGSLNGLIIREK